MFRFNCTRLVHPIVAISLCLTALFTGVASASTVIVAFGDSITRGWPYWQHNLHGGQGGAYPTELARLIHNEQPELDVSIHNWAAGGEVSYQSLMRFDGVMAASRPHYVLIMVGTNDLWSGISPYTTAANIELMIQKARAAGAKPIVSNLTPSYYPGHRGDRIAQMYNPLIEREVELAKATLNDTYSVFAPDWPNLTTDGLHPNQVGYALLAKTWCDHLEVCAKRDGSAMMGIYELLLSDDAPAVADPDGDEPF